MKPKSITHIDRAACFAALAIASLTSASAQLAGQYGILDLTANGGINPNTGNPWAEGDQYRLAFYTAGKTPGTSNDPADYDNFATAEANLSTLGDGSITTSTGWTALVWVNTDPNQAQGSALSDPTVRAGLNDFTDGPGIGGAGVPVYAMDGTTCIARNNADIDNAWSNPFAGDAVVRLASGSTNNNSNGDPTVAAQNVHYSPFLDQFGLGDSATVHGVDVITGGIFDSHVNAAGDITLAGSEETTYSRGNTNANNTGRIWNRFTDATSNAKSVYAISPLLTVGTGTPAVPLVLGIASAVDPGTGFNLEWPSKDGKAYRIRSSATLDTAPATWAVVQEDILSAGTTTTLNVTPAETKLFYVVEEYDAPPAN